MKRSFSFYDDDEQNFIKNKKNKVELSKDEKIFMLETKIDNIMNEVERFIKIEKSQSSRINILEARINSLTNETENLKSFIINQRNIFNKPCTYIT